MDDLKDLPASPCLSSRVTTGIAIDAQLLPLINQVEVELLERIGQRFSIESVRCRIREGAVAIQIESSTPIDFEQHAFSEESNLVKQRFLSAGYGGQAQQVLFEPYAMGSAFLIETEEIR